LHARASFITSKTIQKLLVLSEKTPTVYISSIATARTETTRGPTYSMARTIGAHGKKASSVDAIICVAAHSGSHSLTTSSDLSSGHIDESYRIS